MKHKSEHVSKLWKAFVISLDKLWTRKNSRYRHTDKFDDFWIEMIEFVSSDEVAIEISNGYVGFEAEGNNKKAQEHHEKAADLVLLELDSYNKAVKTLEKHTKSNKKRKSARSSLFSKGKVVLGSIQDVFNLSSLGKHTITVFKEGVELFEE